MIRKIAILGIFLVFCGCAKFKHMDELLTLKSVNTSQDQMDRVIKQQEARFQKLLSAVDNERIKQGMRKRSIIRTYGEPISSKYIDEPPIKEMIMYRHPTQFFGSEKVYFYFDKDQKLVEWEYIEGSAEAEF